MGGLSVLPDGGHLVCGVEVEDLVAYLYLTVALSSVSIDQVVVPNWDTIVKFFQDLPHRLDASLPHEVAEEQFALLCVPEFLSRSSSFSIVEDVAQHGDRVGVPVRVNRNSEGVSHEVGEHLGSLFLLVGFPHLVGHLDNLLEDGVSDGLLGSDDSGSADRLSWDNRHLVFVRRLAFN